MGRKYTEMGGWVRLKPDRETGGGWRVTGDGWRGRHEPFGPTEPRRDEIHLPYCTKGELPPCKERSQGSRETLEYYLLACSAWKGV